MSEPTDGYDDTRWKETAQQLGWQIQNFQRDLDSAEQAGYDSNQLERLRDDLGQQYDAMQGLLNSLQQQNSVWYQPYYTIASKLIDARGNVQDANNIEDQSQKQSYVASARGDLHDAHDASNTY
jgi:hypothetical protein